MPVSKKRKNAKKKQTMTYQSHLVFGRILMYRDDHIKSSIGPVYICNMDLFDKTRRVPLKVTGVVDLEAYEGNGVLINTPPSMRRKGISDVFEIFFDQKRFINFVNLVRAWIQITEEYIQNGTYDEKKHGFMKLVWDKKYYKDTELFDKIDWIYDYSDE